MHSFSSISQPGRPSAPERVNRVIVGTNGQVPTKVQVHLSTDGDSRFFARFIYLYLIQLKTRQCGVAISQKSCGSFREVETTAHRASIFGFRMMKSGTFPEPSIPTRLNIVFVKSRDVAGLAGLGAEYHALGLGYRCTSLVTDALP